ncbi:MAG: MAPEG family protein [Pseudomonadota bacterium]
MEFPAIVTLIAIVEYMVFSFRVGLSREKYGVKAPATSGNEEWERLFRVQQNTLEQLIIFLPALWIFSYFVHPLIGAGIGCIFLIGRPIYAAAYASDPSTRGTGFIMGYLTSVVLLIGGAGGIVYGLLF